MNLKFWVKPKTFKELQRDMTPEMRLEMRKMVGWDDRDVEDLFEENE